MVILIREFVRANLFALLLVLSYLLSSCERGEDMTMLETLVVMNRPMYHGKPVSAETIGEIKRLLSRYKEDIQRQISEKERIGVLYKNVAIKYLEIDGLRQTIAEKTLQEGADRAVDTLSGIPDGSPAEVSLYHEAMALGYMDKRIYGEALRHLEKALEVFPDNELLHYYAGLCAAKMGKAMIGAARDDERSSWFRLAEEYYSRAIDLYPDFTQALYGLSILLVYELARPAEAEPLLAKLTMIERQNTDALFLLASVYYQLGQYEKAIEQYEVIEQISKSQERVEKARENKKRIMDEAYGGQ
jgi:tetratricopeptide (TPR) repeat protein